MSMNFRFDMGPMLSKLEAVRKARDEDLRYAMAQVAVQMMTWMNTGSPNEPLKPPIRFGTLRGSASAFVGSRLIGVAPNEGGEPTPATALSANANVITIVYNTEYAAKMHEWKGGWGKYTTQDGSAGAKWIERHIAADSPLAMQGIAEILKARAR